MWIEVHRLGDAKVEDLDGAVRRDLDVGRLEIAMDDVLLVSRVEGDRDLPGQAKALGNWQRTLGNAVRKGQAVSSRMSAGG